MSQKIDFDDLFDPSNRRSLDRMLQGLEEFERSFVDAVQNIRSQRELLNRQLRETGTNAARTARELGQVDTTVARGREELEKQSQASQKLFNETTRLVNAKNQLDAVESDLVDANSQLNRQLTDQVRRFRELQQSAQQDERALRDVAREIRNTNSQIATLNSATRRFNQTATAARRSYNGLVAENKRLVAEYRRLNPEIREQRLQQERVARVIRRNTEELSRLDAAIGRNFRNVGNYRSALDGVGGALVSFSTRVLGAASGVLALERAIRSAITVNAQLSDSYANVRRTTGLTDRQVRNLSTSLQRLNTRTTLEGLLEIAEAGGRLNIAQNQLLGFVEAVDRTVVSLGDELQGTTEEIATSLARISSLFRETERRGAGEAIERIGSSLNELSNNTRATGGPILDFTRRLSGIAPQANLSVDQVLGLGAALSEFGQTSEIAGSAVSRFLISIGRDVPRFAAIANTSVEEFSNTLEENTVDALFAVLRGAQAGGGLVALTETLDELGIREVRATSAIGALVNNVDRLEEVIGIANTGFTENTSVLEEFDLRINTLAGSIDQFRLAINSFLASERLERGLLGFFTRLGGEADRVLNGINRFAVDNIRRAIESLDTDTLIAQLDEISGQFNIIDNTLDNIAGIELGRAFARRDVVDAIQAEIDVRNEILRQQSIERQAQNLFNEALENGLTNFDSVRESIIQNVNFAEIWARLQTLIAEEAERTANALSGDDEETLSPEEQRRRLLLLRAEREAEFELLRFRLQETIRINNEIAEDENELTNRRLSALAIANTAEFDLLTLQRDRSLRLLQQRLDDETISVQQSYLERQLILERFESQVAQLNQRFGEGVQELTIIDPITIEEAEQRLGSIQDLFTVTEDSAEDFAEQGKQALQDYIDALIKAQEESEFFANQQREIYAAIGNAAVDTFNGIFDVRIANIDAELQALQEQQRTEVLLAGNNEEARRAIEERFERRILELRRRRARQERAQALFNIAVQTAQNAVTLFAQTIPPGILSAIAIAQGALQAAIVASTPLPEFWKGTDDSPEGWAVVDEKGRELVEKPGGEIEVGTNKGARITYLEKGSKVIPHEQTEDILASSNINNATNNLITGYEQSERINISGFQIDDDKLARKIARGVSQAINKKPQVTHQTIITEKSHKKFITYRNKKVEFLNKRYP